jgi:hypothetical protein
MKKLLVLAVAIMVTFALALPATAQDKADWSFYGSVRMWTAWESVDEDTPPQLSSSGAAGTFFQVGTTKARAITYGTTSEGDDEVAWLLQGNSRIGANVKWGNIGGRFEYGSGPNLRLLYGDWNFGPGTLRIGQDYGAYFYLVSGLCGVGGAECNGIGFGSIYSGRTPQLKLIMGGFQVNLATSSQTASFQSAVAPGAVLLPATVLLANNQTTAGTGFTDTDQDLPKIEASYTFNLGPASLFIGGVYNRYKEVYNVGNTEQDHTVDGWAFGAGVKMGFGPFYVNATAQYAQNPNASGAGPYTIYPSVQLYNPVTNQEEDAKYMAGQLILGFRLSDQIAFEGGFIYQEGNVDSLAGLGEIEQSTFTYYVQMNWSPVKNVFIIPEFGIIDFDKLSLQDTELSYGKTTWLGIKWMINF